MQKTILMDSDNLLPWQPHNAFDNSVILKHKFYDNLLPIEMDSLRNKIIATRKCHIAEIRLSPEYW